MLNFSSRRLLSLYTGRKLNVYEIFIRYFATPCSEKNIPDIFNCDLKKNYQILIIFDTNIFDTIGDQMSV